MTGLQVSVALLVVCVPAWIWLQRLVPLDCPGRHILIGGYAALLGLLVTTMLMRVLSLVGIPFSMLSVSVAAFAVTLAGVFLPAKSRTAAAYAYVPARSELSRLKILIIIVCVALLASRFISLGLEVGTRPVTSWDAKQHWAKQAKVFFDNRSTVPYVARQDWLRLGGEGVYTNLHPDYPITIPLIQAWMAVVLDKWDESLVNIPWLFVWSAMGFVFFAQARFTGSDLATAVAGTYMLLSMPYVNIHVALAGYADLFMSACYLSSVAAFYAWSRTGYAWQLTLALLSGVACLFIKNEGFYWLLSLLPGFLLVTLGSRKAVLGLGLLSILGFLCLWLMPKDLVIAGHSLAGLNIGYRPESWQPIYLSFFVHDNWHFLPYLAVTALFLVPLFARQVVPLAAVIVTALAMYLFLYLFTANSAGAVRFTSLNRVALQLMPAIAFFCLVTYSSLAKTTSKNDTQVRSTNAG